MDIKLHPTESTPSISLDYNKLKKEFASLDKKKTPDFFEGTDTNFDDKADQLISRAENFFSHSKVKDNLYYQRLISLLSKQEPISIGIAGKINTSKINKKDPQLESFQETLSDEQIYSLIKRTLEILLIMEDYGFSLGKISISNIIFRNYEVNFNDFCGIKFETDKKLLEKRVKNDIENFVELYRKLLGKRIDKEFFKNCSKIVESSAPSFKKIFAAFNKEQERTIPKLTSEQLCQLEKEGNFEVILMHYLKVLEFLKSKSNPSKLQLAGARYHLGRTHSKLSNYKDSISLLAKAYEGYLSLGYIPEAIEASKELAIFYLRAGKYAEAREIAEKAKNLASKKNTSKAVALLSSGIVEYASKNYEEAITTTRNAIPYIDSKSPLRLTSYMMMGTILQTVSKFKEAANYYMKAITIARNYETKELSQIHNNLGVLYQSVFEYQKAEDHLNQAMSIKDRLLDKDSFIATKINMSSLLYKIGKQSESIKYAQIAFDLVTASRNASLLPVVYNNLAIHKEGKDALKLLENAKDYASKSKQTTREILNNIGVCKIYESNYHEAVSYFKEASKEGIPDSICLLNLGLAYQLTEDSENFLKLMKTVKSKEHRNNSLLLVPTYIALASYARKKGDNPKAFRWILKARHIAEKSPITESNSLAAIAKLNANLYKDINKPFESARLLEKALCIPNLSNSAKASICRELGVISKRLGNELEAKGWFYEAEASKKKHL